MLANDEKEENRRSGVGKAFSEGERVLKKRGVMREDDIPLRDR